MFEKESSKSGEHQFTQPINTTVGFFRWLQINLFASKLNTTLTFLSIWIIYISVPPVIQWAFLEADWVGSSRDDCTKDGACWVYIGFWFKQIMYGRYPETEVWRINVSYILLVGSLVPLLIPGFKYKGLITIFLLFVYPTISYFLFYGDSFGLLLVETPLWGGLFLTLVISLVGIVASLPIGILLALGRRSSMPIVKALSIGFIEIWRGVPLITVLFMSSVMFPLFLPEGMNFDKLLRALVGVMFFSAAYMAEVVRGGLQAIPKGQIEAAEALGMNYWNTMSLIVMPQALKMVIPGIVNSFIALFKDTTLVLTIGLFDLLGTIQIIGTNAEWLGFHIEGYVFTAFIFWIFCFGMSRYSLHLEKKLHTGH